MFQRSQQGGVSGFWIESDSRYINLVQLHLWIDGLAHKFKKQPVVENLQALYWAEGIVFQDFRVFGQALLSEWPTFFKTTESTYLLVT